MAGIQRFSCRSALLLSSSHRSARPLHRNIPNGRRHFHEGIYIEAVSAISNAFHYVHHDVGLDWVSTIVVVGAVFDRTVRFPLTWYANRRTKEREALTPLITMWSQRFQMAASHKEQMLKGKTPKEMKKHKSDLVRESVKQRQAKTKEIYKRFGLQRWKSIVPVFASIPPYILFVDALRRLSGAGTFFGQHVVGDVTTVDPTLTTGGMLWFQDLTIADPYMALPAICASVAWYRMYRRYGKEKVRSFLGSKGATPIPRIAVITGRIQFMLPSLFIVASHLPSGVFIFTTVVAVMGVADDIMLKKLKIRMPTVHDIPNTKHASVITGAGALDARKAVASLGASRSRGR